MLKDEKPRYSNTGVLCTSESPLRACVDWVSVTFRTLHNPHDIIALLGLESELFTSLDYGNGFYSKQLRFGNIQVFYDHNTTPSVHLNISGQGCREYEQTFKNGADWSWVFALFLNWDIHFTRLDLAIDDFKGYFTLNQIVKKIKKAELTSKFRKARNLEEYLLKDGSTIGQTIYFGKSEVMIRFYNKYFERVANGFTVQDDITFWNRYEIQLRDDRADSAAVMIANNSVELGSFIKGIMYNYIDFKTPSETDTNKRRWKTAKFWKTFLDDCGKIPLSQVAPDKTIEKSELWLNKSVAPTLAMIYKAYDYNDKLINDLLKEGLERLEDKHEDMITRFKINTKHKQELFEKLREEKKKELLKPKILHRMLKEDNKKAQTIGNSLSL